MNLKLLSLYFSLTVLVSLSAAFEGGSGTAGNPYQISTCQQLQNMDNNLTSDYELINDVDCKGFAFKRIGYGAGSSTRFNGNFDGKNHIITNLNIIGDQNEDDVALFGGLGSGSTVENLVVLNASSQRGDSNTAILVAENYGIVNNTYVAGSVDGSDGAGGLVARNDGDIFNSHSAGKVFGGDDVGGLVGRNIGKIYDSYSTSRVSGNAGVGGLVGYNSGSSFENSVFRSFSTGKVTGSSYIGGLIGDRAYEVYASNSYWDLNNSLQSSSNGGTDLTTGEMTGSAAGANMAGFDFQDTWSTQSFYYPRLQWMEIGSGTESDPFMIYSCNELQALRNNLTANYELANDIDCSDTENWDSGNGFEPVGPDYQDPFTGTLNGQSFTVDRLFIDRGSSLNVGLIGYLDGGGLIENITVADADLSGDNNAGIIVGRANDGDINSVSSSGNISAASNIGGVVGYMTSSNINSSYSSANVYASGIAGGLIGRIYLNDVSSSFSMGEVSGDKVGGLVGEAFNSNNISSSFSGSNVSGGDYVGGLLGDNDGDVESSFSYGSVTGSSNVGGLLGYNGGSVADGYWDTESSGQSTSDGGSGLTKSEMQGCDIESNLQGFDFENTWSTMEADYPALRFFVSGGISCGVSLPLAPTLLLPIDGSTQVPVKTNLSVTAEGTGLQNITFYHNNSGADSVIGSVLNVNASNSEMAQVEWTGLNTSSQYEWYAVAENSEGPINSSSWSFTTEEKPVVDSLEPAHDSNTEPNPELKVNVSDDISNDIEVRFYDSSDQLLETVSGLSSGGQAVYDPSLDSFASTSGQTYDWYAVVQTDSGAVLNSSQAPSFEEYWNFTTQNLISVSIDVKFGDQVNMNSGSADIGTTDLRFEPWNPSTAVMDNVTVDVNGSMAQNFFNVPSNSTQIVDISTLGLSEDQTYSWTISVEDSGAEVGAFNGEFTTHTVDIEAVPLDDSHDSINVYYSENGVDFSELKSFSRSDSSPLSIKAANSELFHSDSHCYTAATSRLGLESSKSPEKCVGGIIP